LSELIKNIPRYPQVLRNIKIPNSFPKDKINDVVESIKEIAKKLEKQMKGRIVIRPSGTEPKIRIMVEEEDSEKVLKISEELENITKKLLAM